MPLFTSGSLIAEVPWPLEAWIRAIRPNLRVRTDAKPCWSTVERAYWLLRGQRVSLSHAIVIKQIYGIIKYRK